MNPRRAAALGTVGALGLAGAATTAWAVAETRHFGVRELAVPVLPAGGPNLRLLHLSDLHLTPHQGRKIEWLKSLAGSTEPDLVVVTGDFLGHREAVSPVLDALDGLLDLPGVFVLGSNDYYGPRIVNPLEYLTGPSELTRQPPSLPWGDLVAGLRSAGWQLLDNTSAELSVQGRRIALRGVADAHIDLDDYGPVAGPFPTADVRIGVTHSPYLRVLDAMAGDGADLILAGHTHGGQVCLPGGRAIVTNCDLDPARASGLSRHHVGQQVAGDSAEGAFLHVSQGIGTAPSAPIRLFCPPRATVLTLTAG